MVPLLNYFYFLGEIVVVGTFRFALHASRKSYIFIYGCRIEETVVFSILLRKEKNEKDFKERGPCHHGRGRCGAG